MKEQEIKTSIANMLKARFPIIYINTYEESRVIKLIDDIRRGAENAKEERRIHMDKKLFGKPCVDKVYTKRFHFQYLIGYKVAIFRRQDDLK